MFWSQLVYQLAVEVRSFEPSFDPDEPFHSFIIASYAFAEPISRFND
jgi:hypothetical protein